MQDPAFAAALRRLGQRPVILRGGLTLLVRRIVGLRLAMLPRATPPPDLFDQLRHARLHRLPLILSPEVPCALPPSLHLCAPRQRAVLDLSGSPQDRRAALHPKWRNQLRKAETAGMAIDHAPLPPDPNHPLLLAEGLQARTRGYANWPARLTAAFAAAAPAQTRLFTARHDDTVVAHMLFLLHGTGATYHVGQTTASGRALCAHNLLLWEAAHWLGAVGAATLDLGLLHPGTTGLDRFKLRTGAAAMATGGTWLSWPALARRGGPWSSPLECKLGDTA